MSEEKKVNKKERSTGVVKGDHIPKSFNVFMAKLSNKGIEHLYFSIGHAQQTRILLYVLDIYSKRGTLGYFIGFHSACLIFGIDSKLKIPNDFTPETVDHAYNIIHLELKRQEEVIAQSVSTNIKNSGLTQSATEDILRIVYTMFEQNSIFIRTADDNEDGNSYWHHVQKMVLADKKISSFEKVMETAKITYFLYKSYRNLIMKKLSQMQLEEPKSIPCALAMYVSGLDMWRNEGEKYMNSHTIPITVQNMIQCYNLAKDETLG